MSLGEGLFDGIEHGPQDVELELQYLECAFLLFTGLEVIERDLQAVFNIALRERDTRAEIGQVGRASCRERVYGLV